jgi:hypothetical protein
MVGPNYKLAAQIGIAMRSKKGDFDAVHSITYIFREG